MQRLIVSLVFILGLASAASAQIGKSVPVPAGSDEDKAVAAITAAPDGREKVALLDKFMADYGKGDFELLADQLYVQTYTAQKNYAKVYEYGDKALALDPDNLSSAVSIVRAADAQGDTPKLFDTGEKIAAIMTRFKASAAPNGVLPDQWVTTKQQALTDEQADIGFVRILPCERGVQDCRSCRANETLRALCRCISGLALHNQRPRPDGDRLPANAERPENDRDGSEHSRC